MDSKKKNLFSLNIFQLLGAGFVFVWVVDFITKSMWFGFESFQFLFFCSTMLLVGGIGFYLEKPKIVASALALTMVFQIPWLMDMSSILFFGHSSNFSASYIYDLTFWQYLITLRHFFMIPVLLYGLSRFEDFDFKDTVFWAVYLLVIGVGLSVFFAPLSEDINYSGNLPHRLVPTGDFVLDRVVMFCMTTVIIALVAWLITKIPFRDLRWKIFIKTFSKIYIIIGIILSIFLYFKIF